MEIHFGFDPSDPLDTANANRLAGAFGKASSSLEGPIGIGGPVRTDVEIALSIAMAIDFLGAILPTHAQVDAGMVVPQNDPADVATSVYSLLVACYDEHPGINTLPSAAAVDAVVAWVTQS
mgnify:CR=1 FL=1